jgi:hypothetical protein
MGAERENSIRGQKETIMLDRFIGSTMTAAIAATVIGVAVSISIMGTSAQAPDESVTAPVPAPKTPWGEPDLNYKPHSLRLWPCRPSALVIMTFILNFKSGRVLFRVFETFAVRRWSATHHSVRLSSSLGCGQTLFSWFRVQNKSYQLR